MIYLELLWGFLKVGMFSFGGAYMAIPLIRDVISAYGWMDDEMLTEMIAVSESTPGPIMVNLATYVGSSQGGFLGAVIATAAVTLPAFVIVLLLMVVLKKLIDRPVTKSILNAITPCVVGVILATGLYLVVHHAAHSLRPFVIDWRAVALTAGLSALFFGVKEGFKKKFSPILLIGIAAVAGILVYGWN